MQQISQAPLILLVDDQAEDLLILQQRLQREGYSVLLAQSGAAALNMLEEHPVSLVLLDLDMPVMDGLTTLEKIRGSFPARQLPVIIVSARMETSTKVEALARGATDYMTKPLEFAFLKAKLLQLLAADIAAVPELPQVGGRFLHYQIVGQLGEGAMGRVLRARDLRLGREVALKIMFPQYRGLERLFLEARVVAQLHHPNLCVLFEMGETPLPYIAMELVPGVTLQQRLESGPVAASLAVRWMSEVADTLAVVHAQGVLHRDLKPANLMLTPEGAIKLLDFGLAKMTMVDEQLSVSGELFGTPEYMAPEHFDPSLGEITVRSDVYSLATILFLLLTGKLPFTRNSLGNLIQAVLYDPLPALPAGLPASLHEVCRRGLARLPGDRYASASEFAQACSDVVVS